MRTERSIDRYTDLPVKVRVHSAGRPLIDPAVGTIVAEIGVGIESHDRRSRRSCREGEHQWKKQAHEPSLTRSKSPPGLAAVPDRSISMNPDRDGLCTIWLRRDLS